MQIPRSVAGLSLLLATCGGHPDHATPASASETKAHAGEHAEPEQAHAVHDEHAGGAEGPAPTGNPVQQEMQLLTAALESAVRGIGNRDVRSVEHALHKVHAAKGATGKAIGDGSYRPPKNPDGLERFEELDEAFHAELVKLVEASRANDIAATADALGGVMRGCEGCHSEFRP